MTDDDLRAREAIRDTLARYNMAGDRLRTDDFLAVFTEDAVFESANRVHGGGWRHEGRAAIAEWVSGWGKAGPAPATPDRPRPAFAHHHLATCLIDLDDAEAATVRTYWTVFTQLGPDHGGVYADRFRKVGERWLIAHRRIRTEWHAPGSLFAPG